MNWTVMHCMHEPLQPLHHTALTIQHGGSGKARLAHIKKVADLSLASSTALSLPRTSTSPGIQDRK